ncbi:MAG TPA: pyridoxal phosphate-dependent aminotransferase [Solirubrobacteraceae bacterium]|nr:pyridoxal phosphate-dependent aminotransferase [Solirubrobacteraceae bacterium]
MIATRLRPFGTTIFSEMSALAARTGAINLGQGFPDTDGPAEIMAAVETAMRSGQANQYAPIAGVPELCSAIAEHQRRHYGLEVDPSDGVQVTFGATEAIAATMLGLLDAGDEVVVIEPFYDSYAATIALAGASRRLVTLRPPVFALDLDALAAAAPGARMLVLNSPHNPTGRVLTRAELEGVARVCVEHDLIAVTDEVYEHLVYEGTHIPLATLPGMADRTLTISSAGKSFSFTGWKIGWCSGPPRLVAGVRAAKQFLSYSGATPLQVAVAGALAHAERHVAPLRDALRAGRDRFCAGLVAAGLDVSVPQGGYFVNADVAAIGVSDAREWCLALPERAGVVAIPTSAFYGHPDVGRTLVRFAFCKRPEVIDEAVGRLLRVGAAAVS